MKESFLLFRDNFDTLGELSNEEAGLLLKSIIEYVTTGEVQKLPQLVRIVFIPIKNSIDRNNKKYKNVVEKRREAGKLGGLAKASKSKQVLASASKSWQTVAKLADSDSDPDSDPDSDGDRPKNTDKPKKPVEEEVEVEVGIEQEISKSIPRAKLLKAIRLVFITAYNYMHDSNRRSLPTGDAILWDKYNEYKIKGFVEAVVKNRLQPATGFGYSFDPEQYFRVKNKGGDTDYLDKFINLPVNKNLANSRIQEVFKLIQEKHPKEIKFLQIYNEQAS